MDRDTDRASLVRDGAGDGLTDPPRRVGRELVATAVLELVDGLHQADVALLDQIQELQTTVRVLLRDRNDETQIGFDEFALGLVGLALTDRQRVVNLLEFIDRDTGFLFEALDLTLGFFPGLDQLGEFLFGHVVLTAKSRMRFRTLFELTIDIAHDLVFFNAQEEVDLALFVEQFLAASPVAFDLRGELIDRLAVEGDVLEGGFDLALALADFRLDTFAFLDCDLLGLRSIDLVAHLLLITDERLHFGDSGDHAIEVDLLVVRGDFFVHAADDVLHFDPAAFELLAEFDDRERAEFRSEKGAQDFDFAFLNALGDFDFAFASEERNAAHLLQVKFNGVRATRVLGRRRSLFGRFLFRTRADADFFNCRAFFFFLGVPRLLRGVDDFDFVFTEEVHNLVDLRRRDELRRQQLVDFLISEVATLKPHIEELFDFFVFG